MAIDSAAKRFSMMATVSPLVFALPMFPPAGTTLTEPDRAHMLVRYAGIAWQTSVSAVASTLMYPYNYWRERRLHRMVRPWMGRP